MKVAKNFVFLWIRFFIFLKDLKFSKNIKPGPKIQNMFFVVFGVQTPGFQNTKPDAKLCKGNKNFWTRF